MKFLKIGRSVTRTFRLGLNAGFVSGVMFGGLVMFLIVILHDLATLASL